MSATKIVVPQFDFSGFYFADIFRRVRSYNRTAAPEITAEEAEEPFIQLERAFALVGHYCNALTDLAACENLWETAKLPESVRAQLRHVDLDLADYSPATVQLLLELAQVPTSSVPLLGAATLFETRRTEEADAVPFEVLTEKFVGPSNVVDAAFGEELNRAGSDGATLADDPTLLESAVMAAVVADVGRILELVDSDLGNAGVFSIAELAQAGPISRVRLTSVMGGEDPLFIAEAGLTWRIRARTINGSTEVNSDGAPTWTPWVTPHLGDKLYVGSSHVLFEQLRVELNTAAVGITGVWEYYDPELSDETPDLVTDNSGTLRFELTTLLGAVDKVQKTLVRITHLPTGTYELRESAWISGKNVVDSATYLGQSGTPSTRPEDYSVGCDWNPISGQVDGTSNLTATGDVLFNTLDIDGDPLDPVPQNLRRNWTKLSIGGVEGWFVRFRITALAGGASGPVIDRLKIDGARQFVFLDAVQGQTVSTEPLASSSGLPAQEFSLATSPALRDSVQVFVDEGGGEVEWESLSATGDLLAAAGAQDRVFEVLQDASGNLTVKFGDGTRGRVPPLGVDNLRFTYRVDANQDGNVGAGTVVVNSDGPALVKTVTNPRAASGWREADGATETTLALAKELAPARMRAQRRASSSEDYETLAVAWRSETGTRPVIRAKAVEEGFGPKTIKLIVVGTRGVGISATLKAELELYFNGDPDTGEGGVGGANTETTVVNFTPRWLTPTVSIECTSALTEAAVRQALATFLSPTARTSAGTAWVWRFGGRVALSRIASEVFSLSTGNVFDVDVLSPTVDLDLTEDELPFLDASALVVQLRSPS